ncbi:hypothetical protein [Gottfriedia acidiceleris]|uniref:hypothetical protein n=1 Tax=Gottfriedia acidiceleris TaxID=371036 RepID=UPI003D1BFAFB
MARGKNFNHKKKGHEPTHPKGSLVAPEDRKHEDREEDYIVTEEAFKNRIQ